MARVGQASRYILRQIAGPFALLTLAFTAVAWLTQSLGFIDLIVNRGLSMNRFVMMTLALTPGFLVIILPVALFVAVLHSYHRLIYDSEIVAMRSAGLSHWSTAAPALWMAAAVTATGYALTLYVAPTGFSAFKVMQHLTRSDQASVLLQSGVFNSFGHGVTIYVRERGPRGDLHGLLVHDARNRERPVTVMAERGILQGGDQGVRLVLHEGNRQEIDRDRQDVSLVFFERYALDIAAPTATGARWREPAERTLPSLLFPNIADDDDREYRNELLAEAHNRLTRPLYALVLALLAVSAVLAGEFNRRTEWRRVAAVAAAAIVFQASGIGLAALIVRKPALAPLLYANLAAWITVGAILLQGPRRRRATTQPLAAEAR